MDIEKEIRREFVEAFEEWFDIEENVPIYSAIWNTTFEADIVISSREQFDYCFAVEVKNKDYWKPKFYSEAFTQASFYNYCKIESGRWENKLIPASFVFQNEVEFGRNQNERYQNIGIENLGAKLKVGVAEIEKQGTEYQRQRLRFGPNEFWRSDLGFNMHSENLISGQRQFGGTRKNLSFFENRIRNLV